MEKNKKIIGLSIGILIVLIIVVSSTYAYWQIIRTQKTPNDIVAACLNLDLNDASTENKGIDLDSAWPISDEEAQNLTGYTFTVTNNCDEEINYIVGLNRVEESNYLLDSSIKLQLDDNSSHVYGDLSDIEYSDADNTEYTSRVSKQVSVETIGASATNTHTIRIWVSDEAPVTEQSKRFLGQVFITGGQGIDVPQRTLLASFDYSKTENDDVTVNYYNDGVLEIAGTGDMKDAESPDGAIVLKLLNELVIQNNIELTEDEQILLQFDGDYIWFMIIEAALSKNISGIVAVHELDEEEWNSWDDIDKDLEGYLIEVEGLTDEEALDKAQSIRSVISKLTGFYSGIKNINFDSNIESIGMMNFGFIVTSIIELPKSLTSISNQSFGYFAVENLIIPNTVTTIGEYAFGEGRIVNFVFENTVESPSQLKTIGNSAFDGCDLSSVVIPARVETIGNDAFNNNTINNLIFEDTIEKPSQLKTIGDRAFQENQLTKVVIPGSVTFIGNYAFEMDSLTEIVVKRTEEDALENLDNYLWMGYGDKSHVTITYDPNYTE